MRVLMINHEFPPLKGGASNASFYLAKHLVRHGVEVYVLTARVGTIPLEEEKEGVRIIRLGIHKNNSGPWSIFQLMEFTFKSFCRASKLAARIKPHLLHAFFTVPNGLTSFLMHKMHRVPYLISLRGADVPGFDPARFGVYYHVLKPLIRTVWKKASRVVSVSVGLRTLAHETYPDLPIDVIPNGVDTDRFCPVSDPIHDNSCLKIISVGKLIERKGYQYLIPAVSRLLEQRPSIKLEVELVGEGKYEGHLKSLVKQYRLEHCFKFSGFVKHEDLPQKLQSADIFILCSFSEGMSNAVLEAMASGLPIISTNIQGSKELVHDGRNGFVIPKKDASAIVRPLLRLLEEPALRLAFGQKSRTIAVGCQWPAIAERYRELYREVTCKR